MNGLKINRRLYFAWFYRRHSAVMLFIDNEVIKTVGYNM
jgi:hypothetical protein